MTLGASDAASGTTHTDGASSSTAFFTAGCPIHGSPSRAAHSLPALMLRFLYSVLSRIVDSWCSALLAMCIGIFVGRASPSDGAIPSLKPQPPTVSGP